MTALVNGSREHGFSYPRYPELYKKKSNKNNQPKQTQRERGGRGRGWRGWRVFVEKGEAAQTPAEGEEMQEVQRGTFPNLAAIQ